MRNTFARMFVFAVVGAFLALSVPSCRKAYDAPDEGVSVASVRTFSLEIEREDVIDTKTILTDPAIETKMTGVSLGFYRSGALEKTEYRTSGFSSIGYTLDVGDVVTVYALVNMGDVTASFPSAESSVPSIVYNVPSYSDVNTKGIPMAGSLTYTDGVSVSGAIPVKRLFAKVTANMTVSWTGNISSVSIKNLNGRLLPFSPTGSVATGTSDLITGVVESCAGSGTQTGTFVMYVPENAIGTIDVITTSADKSPEGSGTVDLKKGYLTYIEAVVNGTGDYGGSITYRSFLGANATNDFSIIRNKQYVWNMTFAESGLVESNWKHGNGVTWTQYRYALSKAGTSLNVGGSDTFQVYRYTDTYTAGVLTDEGTVPYVMPVSEYTYVSSNTGIATVVPSDASTLRVTATGPGSTTVNVTVDGNNLVFTVTASSVITHRLALSADKTSVPYNGSIQLTATYYTTTDGVEDSGTDVTSAVPSVFSIVSGGTNFTISSAGVVILTNPALTAAAGNTGTVHASYSGCESETDVTLTFTNVTTYSLAVTPSSASIYCAGVGVAAETASFAATLTTTTNGVPDGGVPATCTWSGNNDAIATVNASTGVVTAVSAGSITVTASHTATSTSATATVSVVAPTTDYSVSVTPATATINWNQTQQFKAWLTTKTLKGSTLAYENTEEVTTDCTWSSSLTGVATVGTTTGLATGVGGGTTTITATHGHGVATGTLTVKNVYDMTITPSSGTLATGSERTFVVKVKTNGGEFVTVSNASCTWSSSDTTKAYFTSSTSGTLHGSAEGTVTVTVTHTPETGVTLTRTATINVYTGGGIDTGWEDGGDINL